ncbi:hypothetical protein [Providencia manganoxydans]|uniref:phage tail fiber protein n=1 Tax=Providencia manganoxydans TaxID=2923283 RepID=UPI0032D9CDFB
MYNIGTVTTTANSNKVTGTNTKWKENLNGVQPQQVIQIIVNDTVHNNSIASIESNTAMTLNFPFPVAAKDAKYVILTTMVDSVGAAANYMVALNNSNMQARDVANIWMTQTGTVPMTAPDGTKVNLRTAKEMDRLLDGKFDKTGGAISGDVTFSKNAIKSTNGTHTLPEESGTLMQVGDYGWGGRGGSAEGEIAFKTQDEAGLRAYIRDIETVTSVFRTRKFQSSLNYIYSTIAYFKTGNVYTAITASHLGYGVKITGGYDAADFTYNLWTDRNTTKDSNGNLKAASPIVKVFADHIELNEESEGVEMKHLGVGHYLIKGVVGFNADGAWGINNGFVIPQDHNGKNMVLIDYEVRPDGDIEVFVFHQQNADMPERFQNKRIKHFDEDGQPIYFENYEPCDVPESRWIDMRVEMPPNSIYNCSGLINLAT